MEITANQLQDALNRLPRIDDVIGDHFSLRVRSPVPEVPVMTDEPVDKLLDILTFKKVWRGRGRNRWQEWAIDIGQEK